MGFDNIDLNFARSNGITCVNTPDYGVDEVAQTALSFILGISRGSFGILSILAQPLFGLILHPYLFRALPLLPLVLLVQVALAAN